MPDTLCFTDPGYTPARHEIGAATQALLECDDEQAPAIERALGRCGLAAAEHACSLLAHVDTKPRVRLVRLISRIARENEPPALLAVLKQCLLDAEPQVQRAAVIGLGKLTQGDIEDALLDYAQCNPAPPELRALVEALGKVGTARSAEWLSGQSSSDEHTRRLIERSQVMLARTLSRPEAPQTLDLSTPLGASYDLVFTCRRGLELIVSEQASPLGVPRVGSGRVVIPGYSGSVAEAFTPRAALGVGIELALDRSLNPHEALIHALRNSGLLPWMAEVSHGVPRVRLDFVQQGHQRAAVWDLQSLIVREGLALIADPTNAGWDLAIDLQNARVDVLPKRFADPRFSWRTEDLPAASHPTIAAALAHVAGVRHDDVVWDPFVGSGLELIERAKLGPYRTMYGTDIDDTALAAAKANLTAAGVKHATLLNRDATSAPVRDLTLVITNPPMGARLVRDGSLGDLLEEVLAHGFRNMRPEARWVWLSPMPARTAAFAHRLGFDIARHGLVDLGGLSPELQVLTVPPKQKSNGSARQNPAVSDPGRPKRRIVK